MQFDQPSRRMSELIASLLRQTRAGVLQWKRTDRPGSFAVAAKTGSVIIRVPAATSYFESVTIESVTDPQGYSIRLLDHVGDSIEAYATGGAIGSTAKLGRYQPLVDLAELVASRTTDGDPRIDALLREFEAIGAGR